MKTSLRAMGIFLRWEKLSTRDTITVTDIALSSAIISLDSHF